MKRILAVSVLAVMVAATAQGQGTGLMAAGSNFTGPGGGGGGATGSVGAFLPTAGYAGGTSSGLPGGSSTRGFATATASVNVTIGGISVPVSAQAQQTAAGAITGTPNSAGVTTFANSLTGVNPVAATALGNAMAALGDAFRSLVGGRTGTFITTNFNAQLSSAITAFNAAVNSLPAGAPVPASLIAARALIGAYYGR